MESITIVLICIGWYLCVYGCITLSQKVNFIDNFIDNFTAILQKMRMRTIAIKYKERG